MTNYECNDQKNSQFNTAETRRPRDRKTLPVCFIDPFKGCIAEKFRVETAFSIWIGIAC
jgi:hypothetical protein